MDNPLLTLMTQGDRTKEFTIKQLPTSKAIKILGIFLAPAGIYSENLAVLKTKADELATSLQSLKLTTRDIQTFHQTMYALAMRFILFCLAINEEELQPVQPQVVMPMLQKLGNSSKLPTEIRYRPEELGGLGIFDLCT